MTQPPAYVSNMNRLDDSRAGASRARRRSGARPARSTGWVSGAVMVILAAAVSLVGAVPAAALPVLPDPSGAPIDARVVRGFDPPEFDWLPGHRGVDYAVAAGTPVRSAAAGEVTFAGILAGRPVITVTHGDVRTTYEPVTPIVTVGQRVSLGQVLGHVIAGHAGCPVAACLHWGLKQGDEYLDPLQLLTATRTDARLLPNGSAADATARMLLRRIQSPEVGHPDSGPPPGGGLLRRPTTGPVTSPFGMRVDPIKGTWRMHSGTDFGAPCGSAIYAAAAGTVIQVTWHPSYGNRLVIDHGVVGGSNLKTAYNHAQGYSARVGDRVAAAQVIGAIGSTGDSTGCHLHFMVYRGDSITDPMPYLR